MSILVFGRTGQVARELLAQAPVVSLGREDADLSKPAQCAEAIARYGPAAVINAAAYTAVDKAEEEDALATLINADAPAAMAQACAERDIPFVHISTDYVFDGKGETAWRTDDEPAPASVYGRTKLAGEQAIRKAGGRYAIMRTSWVFSSHGNNFLKTMLRLSETRSELSVVDDQIGGPTPASAIAHAALTIANHLGSDARKAGVYHFSGSPDASWADFAREIFSAANRDVAVQGIPSSDYPTPAVRPANSRLDCQKTAETFAIERPDWRAAIPQILGQLEHQK